MSVWKNHHIESKGGITDPVCDGKLFFFCQSGLVVTALDIDYFQATFIK